MAPDAEVGRDASAGAGVERWSGLGRAVRPGHGGLQLRVLPALVLALAVAAVGAAFLVRAVPAEIVFGSRRGAALIGVQLLVIAVVGVVVAARRPQNVVGWLISLGAGLGCLWLLVDAYAVFGLAGDRSPLAGSGAAAWVANWLWIGMWGLVGPLAILHFPDGRLPSPRWRYVAGGVILCAATSMVALALSPGDLVFYPFQTNLLALPGAWGDSVRATLPVLDTLTKLLTVLAAMSLVPRLRSGPATTRHQIKWVAYAAVMAGVLLLAAVVTARVSRQLWLEDIAHLSGALPAVAAGVAILRYRLYDIDRVVSRTVSYGVLTVLLAGVYGGGVLVLSPMLASLGGGSQLAVAGATLAVAALFQPARRRIQVAVDRRFNRSRYDAQRTVEAFVDRLRDGVGLEQVPPELIDAVHASVQPADAFLWLRRPITERAPYVNPGAAHRPATPGR